MHPKAQKYIRRDAYRKVAANKQRLVDAREREEKEWAAIRALNQSTQQAKPH